MVRLLNAFRRFRLHEGSPTPTVVRHTYHANDRRGGTIPEPNVKNVEASAAALGRRLLSKNQPSKPARDDDATCDNDDDKYVEDAIVHGRASDYRPTIPRLARA